MDEMYERTRSLLGDAAVERIRASSVCIIGLGGVGSYAAEACARSGFGTIGLIDHDSYSASNLNRQLGALRSTLGRKKTQVTAERIRDINPRAAVLEKDIFLTADNVPLLGLEKFDFVIDAIDNVTAKTAIACFCHDRGIASVCVMGTGNKLRPEMLEVSDIYSTSVCPLARAVRKLCREAGLPSLKVIYSREEPLVRTRTPASMSFVPAAAGLLAAREAVLAVTGGLTAARSENGPGSIQSHEHKGTRNA